MDASDEYSGVSCSERWPICPRADAQTRLEEQLRPVNQGTARPEAAMAFGTFTETQWQDVGAADAKAVDTTRLQERPPKAPAALLAGLAAAGYRPEGCPAMGRREVPPASGLANGAQFLGVALRNS